MTVSTQEQMKPREIRKVLKRHRGSITAVAVELGISKVTVSDWLRGRVKSARIAEAARMKAIDLLEGEALNA